LISAIAERTVNLRPVRAKGAWVPVTAKLSRKFYEKLGDDVANELVDWFNSVDATYRSDLKELNELNFARFDAKLEQRVAALDAKIEQRAAEVRAEMQAGFARVDAQFLAADAKLEQRLAQMESRLTRRMFGFWIAQAGTTVGLVFGVVKLLGG
jgi:hypothetical protein